MADQTWENTAEGGTDGAQVIAASSGGASGTALANVQTSTQWAYESNAAKGGVMGFQLTIDGTSRYLRVDDTTVSAGERGGCSFWWYYPSAPSSRAFIVGYRDSADALHGSQVIETTGKTGWSNSASGAAQAGSLSALALGAGAWYHSDNLITPGTTSTARVEMETKDAAGVVVQTWDSGANQTSASTNPVGRTRVGIVTNTSGWTTFWVDSIKWGHKTSGFLGDVTNLPPVADAGADQTVSAGGTASLSGSVSDPDGPTPGAAWTWVYNSVGGTNPTLSPNANVVNPTFTVTSTPGSKYTLRLTATDAVDSGLTHTDDVDVFVPTSSDAFPLPGAGTGDSGWTIYGSAASMGAALADSNTATGVESPGLTGTVTTHQWPLGPMSARSSLAVEFSNVLLTSSSTVTATARLKQGSTTIASRSMAATTSAQTFTLTLTGPEVASITNWNDLRAEVAVST